MMSVKSWRLCLVNTARRGSRVNPSNWQVLTCLDLKMLSGEDGLPQCKHNIVFHVALSKLTFSFEFPEFCLPAGNGRIMACGSYINAFLMK